MHSVWITELKLEFMQLILEFGECFLRGRQTQFGSGVISENQLYVYWRFVLKEPVSSVGQVEILCRFRQMFVGVRPRFEKSSPRWRIVGKKIEEIAQRSEVKGSENSIERPG